MSISLKASDRTMAQRLIDSGRFKDIDEVLHAGLEALEDDEHWLAYASARIQQGVEDAEQGNTISGDDFFAQLRQGRLKQA